MDKNERLKRLGKMTRQHAKDSVELTKLIESKSSAKSIHAILNKMIVRSETMWGFCRAFGQELGGS